jgi:putative transposase
VLLQRAHSHVRNQRRDFLHKESRKIINKYGFIAVENLDVAEMATGKFSKSIYDAAWGLFTFMLVYKAEWAGRRLKKVEPKGTSQTCLCGARVPKTLQDRWHHCLKCGLSGPRDHISAKVILQTGKELAFRR